MAADATIRLGKISSVNYSEGKARVTYEDRDQSVTKELPFLAWLYRMPKVSDMVVVACFSNGTVAGVILGPIFGSANTPYEGGSGKFRLEMSNTRNAAVITHSDETGVMALRASKITFEGYGYEDKPSFSLEDLNDYMADMENMKTEIATLQDKVEELEKRVKALGG